MHRAEAERDFYLYGGAQYRGSDALGRLCRVLKEGTLQVYRGQQLCMTVNVAERAKLSLQENDSGFRYIKYRPSPWAK